MLAGWVAFFEDLQDPAARGIGDRVQYAIEAFLGFGHHMSSHGKIEIAGASTDVNLGAECYSKAQNANNWNAA